VGAVVLGRVDWAGAERESIGDRVEAAVTQGIAAQNPPAGEEKAAEDPESFDGFDGVSGAGRLVATAAGKGGGDPALVSTDRPE
jgi:hypothetical protein